MLIEILFKATGNDVREYFRQFGPLEMVDLKTEAFGQVRRSKGFAFIKFKELQAQEKALAGTHTICDRRCEVQMPEANKGSFFSKDFFLI